MPAPAPRTEPNLFTEIADLAVPPPPGEPHPHPNAAPLTQTERQHLAEIILRTPTVLHTPPDPSAPSAPSEPPASRYAFDPICRAHWLSVRSKVITILSSPLARPAGDSDPSMGDTAATAGDAANHQKIPASPPSLVAENQALSAAIPGSAHSARSPNPESKPPHRTGSPLPAARSSITATVSPPAELQPPMRRPRSPVTTTRPPPGPPPPGWDTQCLPPGAPRRRWTSH